jgi:hypothetical protein
MQHDTSPHEIKLAGKKRRVQTASAVLCYSRMLFFQWRLHQRESKTHSCWRRRAAWTQ